MPKFTGKRGEDLETFLAQLKLRFKDNSVNTDEEKVRMVLSCLKDEAATWMTNYINQYSDTQFIKIGGVGVWINYEEFTTYLHRCHGRHDDPKEIARNELLVIQQGRGTVLSYTQEFDRLIALVGLEFTGVQTLLYKRGLNSGIRERLGGLPDSKKWTLEDWQKNAVSLEANRQYRNMPREYKPTMGSDRRPTYQEAKTEYYGEPMDVDAQNFRRRPKRFKKWQKFKPKFIRQKEQDTHKNKDAMEIDQDKRQFRKTFRKGKCLGKHTIGNKTGKQCFRCGQMGHWK